VRTQQARREEGEMLKGRCPCCEEVCYGWALMLEENTFCECGDRLEISEMPGDDLYKRVREAREDEEENKN